MNAPLAMNLCGESSQAATLPVIDAHIHLYDPSRPQGVPWPEKENTALYRPTLPARYRKVAEPFGITGAIEVECSPWLEDNQWVLDVAGADTLMVGTVGDLEPGKPEFPKQLERFHRNPLFLGIRYGNLWGRDLRAELAKPAFIAGLKLLSQAGLTLDTVNPRPPLLSEFIRITDEVPDLRVVIDHLPQLDPPSEPKARRAFEANLRELGKRPKVFIKISEVLRRVDGRVPLDLDFYRPRLDQLYDAFGPDRVLYGSDWPNSDRWEPYAAVFRIVHEYFTAKGPAVAEKYFWKNSVAAYRWRRRDAKQPNPETA